MSRNHLKFGWIAIFYTTLVAQSFSQAQVSVTVDANLNRHPISPLIYGLSWATEANMLDLNATINRAGGNNQSRYNWLLNADNKDDDWYFESIADSTAVPGYRIDNFIAGNNAASAASMLTVPEIGWIANLGANRASLDSYSVAKYGSQTGSDPYWSDAGNGISSAAGNPYIVNTPGDADVTSTVATQQAWFSHLIGKWGKASAGGLKYYLMDNEPSIWYATHRDVHPVGPTMTEILNDIVSYGTAVKAADPSAMVGAPEEWGWEGYLYSGFDQQYASAHGYNGVYPDRAAHGNMDYVPYLLQQMQAHDRSTGVQTLDVLTLHDYPQDGTGSNDVSAATELLRNQSTRSLWDPNYVDKSWINAPVYLIPRMKSWVSTYYPGLKTGITEYNWGAEGSINGATTQADIDGIFGVQGLDIATRWTVPDPSTPTYKAMKMYRNYDGLKSTFGDVSVSATGPDPDNVAVYAATRTVDNRLTIMLINKQLATAPTVTLNLNNFGGNGTSQVWQLTSANAITRQCDVLVPNNVLTIQVPAQSITLLVLPPKGTVVPIPAQPNGLTGHSLNMAATITWPGVPGAMGYTIGRSLSGAGPYVGVTRTTGTSFTNTGLANGTPYYFDVNAYSAAGASIFSAPVEVVPKAPTSDPAQYNFETGIQGWTSSGGLVSSIAQSSNHAFLGSYSLAVNIAATGSDSQYVYVLNPSTPAGSTITFHLWVPVGCGLSAVQPYALQGTGGGWAWSGNYEPVSSLTAGAWNTITVALPSTAVTPLYSLGVQFMSSSAWSGTCYIDSVSW